jgi:hypothetical protein
MTLMTTRARYLAGPFADRFVGSRDPSLRPIEELWLQPLGTLLRAEATLLE